MQGNILINGLNQATNYIHLKFTAGKSLASETISGTWSNLQTFPSKINNKVSQLMGFENRVTNNQEKEDKSPQDIKISEIFSSTLKKVCLKSKEAYDSTIDIGNKVISLSKSLGGNSCDFLSRPSNLIFIAVTALNASFSPGLFCISVTIGIVGRMTFESKCKEFMENHFKSNTNTYITDPYYGPERFVSAFEHSAGFASLSYHLFFQTASNPFLRMANPSNSILFPMLGGIAAGSTIAKMALDIAQGIEDVNNP